MLDHLIRTPASTVDPADPGVKCEFQSIRWNVGSAPPTCRASRRSPGVAGDADGDRDVVDVPAVDAGAAVEADVEAQLEVLPGLWRTSAEVDLGHAPEP